jgi:hypothetical protein
VKNIGTMKQEWHAAGISDAGLAVGERLVEALQRDPRVLTHSIEVVYLTGRSEFFVAFYQAANPGEGESFDGVRHYNVRITQQDNRNFTVTREVYGPRKERKAPESAFWYEETARVEDLDVRGAVAAMLGDRT